MATTLTKTGWFGLSTGQWTSKANNSNSLFSIVDNKAGIRTGTFIQFDAQNNTAKPGSIGSGSSRLSLTSDLSNIAITKYPSDLPAAVQISSTYLNFGSTTISGTGATGIVFDFSILGNGNNYITGKGWSNNDQYSILTNGSSGPWRQYTGIKINSGLQLGNGNNTIIGKGFTSPRALNQWYQDTTWNGAGIYNRGSIIFGSGDNVLDASEGGFSGGGYAEFGSGANTIKGFGDIRIDGGGNSKTKVLFNAGTYQVSADGNGSYQITNTGNGATMDLTNVAQIGDTKTSNNLKLLKQGTYTVDTNGKVTYEGEIGNDAFMVYDILARPDLVDYQASNWNNNTQKYDLTQHELRFATSTNGQTLVLTSKDSGVGSVVLGTGTGAVADKSGKLSLNVDASVVSWGLTITGNAGNNKLNGGSADDTFIAGAGNDSYDGKGGSNIIDYSNMTSGITVNMNGNSTSVSKPKAGNTSIGTDSLKNIQSIIATPFSDVLNGDSGNNTLAGGAAVDIMDGKEGSDTYMIRNGIEHQSAEIKDTGKTGTDTVLFTSTDAGDKLTLFAGDTGIEAVVIGLTPATYQWSDGSLGRNKPEPGTTGTGTTNLDIDASKVLNGLTITGNDGDNVITGSILDNIIYGGGGIDKINGGTGNDQIYGGLGNDILTGGSGKNIFAFDAKPDDTSNRDLITDFKSTDTLLFKCQDSYYTTVFSVPNISGENTDENGNRKIANAQFISGSGSDYKDIKGIPSILSGATRFLYDTTSGILSYDADGNGSIFSPVQVAQLGNGNTHPQLMASNIMVNGWG